MESTNRIIELLYDRQGGYFLLKELAGAVGLDQAGLMRRLDMLTGAGLDIENSPAEGVRLARCGRLIGHLIERNLPTSRIGRSVVCYDQVNSTNDIAFDAARSGKSDGLVVLAESQRKGRGRQGRKWLDKPATNIACSILLINDSGRLAHEPLTIATGLAVSQAIDQCCGLQSELKWPNDVLLDGEKVSGVLIELRNTSRAAVVLGVGINANFAPPSNQVDRPATSLAAQTGQPIERIEIIRALLIYLDYWVAKITQGELDELRQAWVSRCPMINQRITVASAGREFVGRVLDISPLEGIFLIGDDGRRVHLPAAGASIVDSP